MTGLVLKLRPAERVLINGVVIENGDRRSRLSILTPDASILRLRDAIHPTQATTPVTRVCYLAQLILAGEVDKVTGYAQLTSGLAQLRHVFTEGPAHCLLVEATAHADARMIYQCMRSLRALRPIEADLFAEADTARLAGE
ncbi:flagellar protein FlbT [Monaibacterium marinum]|uniref:Flagellar protein FlbT n=1 Tax=Pontivivens marinum TaxID=1690039 RepID=A0A2C9CV05_9RHOB|nr:flagellar biosynthesis repressor FlbT [Monaibacterium marinum]SOH95088.1 flagellar protein FlbT [Monaibacterium marinum]